MFESFTQELLQTMLLHDQSITGSVKQQAQLSPSDRAMRLGSSNLAKCHATVQKLLIQQVLTKLMV